MKLIFHFVLFIVALPVVLALLPLVLAICSGITGVAILADMDEEKAWLAFLAPVGIGIGALLLYLEWWGAMVAWARIFN